MQLVTKEKWEIKSASWTNVTRSSGKLQNKTLKMTMLVKNAKVFHSNEKPSFKESCKFETRSKYDGTLFQCCHFT